MSAASVERHHGDRPLIAEANRLLERLPGYRVEIIGGLILVSPPPDVAHARALARLALPFAAAGIDGSETEVLQGVGLWLPSGNEDYAVPDLVVVDADIEEHFVENNCYEPVAFRLVLEVTSSNWKADLQTKVAAYADAHVPVYVVVDRKHQRLHVLTDPEGNTYATHRVHAPGELVTLPDSLGAKVTLDVAEILDAGQAKRTP
ncbi:Uma2 family endonuclease [Streptomyces turgidiscabies]|uniref:Uma2 family endonuclease n=1 Tax=Streptomyces turgidiscabies TaxID=85558 RepID=A0ABU0RJL2_9ACTN|nr:Uma2 family endonuclease [Streptomyces turgidiscabies]MDQ0932144.1 Uma2 family endonuclease [Streptomyces turgidiscabies]